VDDDKKVNVKLESTSIVDARSGEVETPKEAIERFRDLEVEITRADEAIETIQAELKEAKGDRDEAVANLRAACREAKALPLFDRNAA
jgi:post-segregation antitoxin (ccd killing protein)